MNRAAINAFALNGNIHQRIPSVTAEVVIGSSLPIIYGLVIGGEAAVQIQSGVDLYKQSRPETSGSVAVESDLNAYSIAATMGYGEAPIEVSGAIDPRTIFHPTLYAGVSLESGVIEHVVRATRLGGKAPIRIESDLISYIIEAPRGSGLARFRVVSRLAPHVAKSRALVSRAGIRANAGLYANLRINEGGQARVEVAGSGAARLGGKLSLSGRGDIRLAARGSYHLWHHVHGEGSANIEIRLKAERYGIPVIPTDYVPARPDWTFMVPRDDWHFVVPRDNWGRR